MYLSVQVFRRSFLCHFCVHTMPHECGCHTLPSILGVCMSHGASEHRRTSCNISNVKPKRFRFLTHDAYCLGKCSSSPHKCLQSVSITTTSPLKLSPSISGSSSFFRPCTTTTMIHRNPGWSPIQSSGVQDPCALSHFSSNDLRIILIVPWT